MTLSERLTTDLPVFLNLDHFAIPATIAGVTDPVNGLFDPGMADEREPRSPAFTCRESDLDSVTHGVQVTIQGQAYYLEGFQPDGHGMATIILRRT